MDDELKKLFELCKQRGPRPNADGTVTTMHGHRIIPHKLWVGTRTALHSNRSEYASQPRAKEIRAMLEPFKTSPFGDDVIVNEKTGEVHLESAPEKILGKIDPELEDRMLKFFVLRIAVTKNPPRQKLFGLF